MNNASLVIADADALIAFANPDDIHHHRARLVSQSLDQQGIAILFPTTAIIEAVTTLQRKLTKPQIAAFIVDEVKEGTIAIQEVDQDTLIQAVGLFHPLGSKQNTLFDAVVAALAKRLNADAIFSFDEWYRKIGLTLTDDLIAETKHAA